MTSKRWTDEFLDEMRELGDPPADEAVRFLFEEGDIAAVNALLFTLIENDDPPAEQLPPIILDYINHTDDLPYWADREQISRGESLFARYGPQAFTVLLCYSLPACYAARDGVQVLYQTARMVTNTRRRIVETAQMVIDVMSPGGTLPGGKGLGIRTAQKVRLLHAAIRRLILQSGKWEPERGLPINQEELAGTLLTFSYCIVDGLQKLGVDLEPEEANAFLHAWNVIGSIMGVRYDLLAQNMEEAAVLKELIQQRQYGTSRAGREMTRALLELAAEIIPGERFDGFAASLIRYFNGDETADMLDVPEADWTQLLIKPLEFMIALGDDFGDEVSLFATASEFYSRELLRALFEIERGGQRPSFHIPTELKSLWGI